LHRRSSVFWHGKISNTNVVGVNIVRAAPLADIVPPFDLLFLAAVPEKISDHSFIPLD
jgi:hypothetical protein